MKLICAMSNDGVIGVDNRLPWKVPSELRIFKHYTKGHTVVMGRNTYESLPRRPLQGRTNVVVSRGMETDTRVIVERLASRVGRYKNAYVIGGAQLYQYALENDLVSEMVISIIDTEVSGQYDESQLTRFPWDMQEIKQHFKWTTRTHFKPKGEDQYGYTTYNFIRK